MEKKKTLEREERECKNMREKKGKLKRKRIKKEYLNRIESVIGECI